MYRPSLRPGEELVRSSPDVTVKNVPFDAFLTNKRMIFVKKTEDFQERKELVFPLNLVKDFKPSSDDSGTPDIRFSIEKPSGEVGDLILRFIQTGDYRYAERDDWIESLRTLSNGDVIRPNPSERNMFSESRPPVERPPETGIPGFSDAGNSREDSFISSPPAFNRDQDNSYSRPPQPPSPPPSSFPDSRASAAPGPQKTQFCRFCGAKIPSGSSFCPSCGGKIEEKSEAQHGPGFSQQTPPPAPSGQAGYGYPPVSTSSPPPPPVRQEDNRGFVSPPPPPPSGGQAGYGRQPGYPPQDGGISLSGDQGYGYGGRDQQMSPRDHKSMIKEQAKAEKARQKEEARYQKEQRKAMKASHKGGGGRDPYGYRESRVSGGIPKIAIIAVAVIAVLAVVGYAFSSGMIGGNGGGQPAQPSSSGDSQSSTEPVINEPGSTTISSNFGTYYLGVYYPGEWSGSYTVNGVETRIPDDPDSDVVFGTKEITLENAGGTITLTVKKEEDISTPLEAEIRNQKGVTVASDKTTAGYGEITISTTVT